MKVITSPQVLQKEMERLRLQGKILGFVPTMGALHQGHLELVRQSRKRCDVTIVSIFVNPTQFGPHEDFHKYPRPLRRDKQLLKTEKADYLFLPSVISLYPEGQGLFVDIQSQKTIAMTEAYCGKYRPGHFRGVLTICAKLFHCVKPHYVYMGAKDYQQTVVIEQLLSGLCWDIQLVRVPTVRELDGLALSSRNVYLNPEERRRALEISKTLFAARDALKQGRPLKDVLRLAHRRLLRAVDKIDYFAAADARTLKPLQTARGLMVLLTACYVGKTRLIDNVTIRTRSV